MGRFRALKEKLWGFFWDGLWTEGLRIFFAYRRSWAKGAVLFLIVQLLVNYDYDHVSAPVFWGGVKFLLLGTQCFYFIACFLNQEPIAGQASVTIRHPGFCQLFRVFAYMAGVVVVLGLAASAASLSTAQLFGKSVLSDLISLVCLGLVFWLMMRVLFIVPLAINEINSPVTTSWRLSKGKVGRLAVSFTLLLLMGIPLLEINDALFQVIMVGIAAAFACAACRVLYGENIAEKLGRERRAVQRAS